MKRFTYDGRRIHVYDGVNRAMRVDVPRNVAVETEFNSITLRSGEKDRAIEACLADVDDAALVALRKLEAGDVLSRLEKWSVSFFAGYADARGRGFRAQVQSSLAEPIDYLRAEYGFADAQLAEALSAIVDLILIRTAHNRGNGH